MIGLDLERLQLIRDGFCVIPNVLSLDMLETLRAETTALLNGYSNEDKQQSGGQGSILDLPYTPSVFTDLITWEPALNALGWLGFPSIRYWGGYVIAREPHTPAAYWHQDWPWWDDPTSADPVPSQLFLMYYLTDTNRENGCLRVIPGSHRRRFPEHRFGSHDSNVRHDDPETSPAYADAEDQVDAIITAGDLLVGDARLLHAPRANQTGNRRTVITMWYLPRWEDLPEAMKSAYPTRLYKEPPAGLDRDRVGQLEPLLPRYEGDAAPATWNRVPGHHLALA